MKAELEKKEACPIAELKGIEITSESDEQARVLTNIWVHQGRVVEFNREGPGKVTLTIAPSPDKE